MCYIYRETEKGQQSDPQTVHGGVGHRERAGQNRTGLGRVGQGRPYHSSCPDQAVALALSFFCVQHIAINLQLSVTNGYSGLPLMTCVTIFTVRA